MSRAPFVILACLTLVTAVRADEPVGSAYLRTLSPAVPPFGSQRGSDTYPYDGVRMQRWRRDQGEVDWLIVWIDLRTPGLGYRVSPLFDQTGPDGWNRWQSARGQTTLDFLRDSSDEPRVDLAVNMVAYFFFPASDGSPVYLSEPVWRGDNIPERPPVKTALLGLLPGSAKIGDEKAMRAAKPVLAFGGFRGENNDIEDGVAVRAGKVATDGEAPHGRTLIGVSADGRVLTLLIADGYNPGVSIGLSPKDAATVIAAAGAKDAVFMDGGGSSTLVGRAGNGDGVVLNRPAGLQSKPGTLRYVAVNLGFTNLRRTADPLPGFPDWEAPLSVVLWQKIVVRFRVYPKTYFGLLLGTPILLLVAVRLWRQRRAGLKAKA